MATYFSSCVFSGNDGYFDHEYLATSLPGRVNDMATRVVTGLIASGVYDAELEVGRGENGQTLYVVCVHFGGTIRRRPAVSLVYPNLFPLSLSPEPDLLASRL